MFSNKFNVDEAVSRVKSLSYYFFTENFNEGVFELNRKTGLNLVPAHIRKTGYEAPITKDAISKLREVLDQEYIFIDLVRKAQNS